MQSKMLRTLLVVCCYALALAQKQVDTQYGPVVSHVVNVSNGETQTTIDVYYGIPFAADTSGNNRFRSPVPPTPWALPLDANTMPPSCAQSGGPDGSEDCLQLNVFAPTGLIGPYPVMLWIYGGGYQSGSVSFFPGHFLASRDVVVVTVNYRLGKLGFAYTGNSACPGNAGMWDQNMGIQWVVDNIANFGGDPNRITVFGESAGASSTSLHLLSPHSNTLFQQAIIESGSELVIWGLNPPESDPQNYTYELAKNLNCERLTDELMMDCLRALPWRDVVDGQIGRCAPGFICVGMAPVVDGPGGFMPQKPVFQRMDGDVMQGPIIAGINREDGSLFAPLIAPAIFLDDCCNRTYFEYAIMENMIRHFDSRLKEETMVEIFNTANFFYSPWPHLYDNNANRDKIVEFVSDASFGNAFDRQVKDHQLVAPTYSYIFDYLSALSTTEPWVGTFHGAEIDFVFGFPLLASNPEVESDFGMNGSIFTQQDIDFSTFMMKMWVDFAYTGNPTSSPLQNPIDGGFITWPSFTPETQDYLYMSPETISILQEYRQKELAFWHDYVIVVAGDELGIDDEWTIGHVDSTPDQIKESF